MSVRDCITLAKSIINEGQDIKINCGNGDYYCKLTKIILLVTAATITFYSPEMECKGTNSMTTEEWKSFCVAKPYVMNAVISERRKTEIKGHIIDDFCLNGACDLTNSAYFKDHSPNHAFFLVFYLLAAIALLNVSHHPWEYFEGGSVYMFSTLIQEIQDKAPEIRQRAYEAIRKSLLFREGHRFKFLVYLCLQILTVLGEGIVLLYLMYVFDLSPEVLSYKRQFETGKVDPYARNDRFGRQLPSVTFCINTGFGYTGMQLLETTLCYIPANGYLQIAVIALCLWYFCIMVLHSVDVIWQTWQVLQIQRALSASDISISSALILHLLRQNIGDIDYENIRVLLIGYKK